MDDATTGNVHDVCICGWGGRGGTRLAGRARGQWPAGRKSGWTLQAPTGCGRLDQLRVVVDKATACLHVYPSCMGDTALDTAKRFFDNVVRPHGLPEVIVSHGDSKFTLLC